MSSIGLYKPNDEHYSESRLVINELLTYLIYHLDRYPVNKILVVILQLYHAYMIYDVKRILRNNYWSDLSTIWKGTNKEYCRTLKMS